MLGGVTGAPHMKPSTTSQSGPRVGQLPSAPRTPTSRTACDAQTENISAPSEHRVTCTIRLFRCLVPLHLPQATLQIGVFRPVPITPRQLFSDIMRSIHFTLCEDQLPKTRFL